MSNNEQTRSFSNRSNEIEDKNLWKRFVIYFHRKAPRFPGNKIYATINIEPESARRLIKKFTLIVNDTTRNEFSPDYHELSASGFDRKKEKNPISVKIQAIPFNYQWETIKKESDPCDFSFTNEIFGLSPTISYDWIENDSKANVVVKWYHMGDECTYKYIVLLDNKEIHYINQTLIRHEIEIYIHDLKPCKEHTIEVVAILKNGKETYRSDLITFNVPKEKNEQNNAVINVNNEPLPLNLLAVIEIDKDKKTKEPLPVHDGFRQRAFELYQLLKHQMEERRRT